jgi:quercetin dioxygenase-like cupin family protein
VTVEHEGRKTTVYKAGDSLCIEAGKIHVGTNVGNLPVKLIGPRRASL